MTRVGGALGNLLSFLKGLFWWQKPLLRRDEDIAPPPIEPPPAEHPPDSHPSPEKQDREKKYARKRIGKERRTVADMTSDILDRLARLDLRSGSYLGAYEESQSLGFLMGCDFFLLHEVIEETPSLVGGSKYVILNPAGCEDQFAETCWPIDEGICSWHEDGGYVFTRMATVAPKEVRGRVQMVVPKMLRMWHATICSDGTWYANDVIIGLVNKRWVQLDQNRRSERRSGFGIVVEGRNVQSAKFRQEVHDNTAMMLALSLSRRYAWHVALGTTADGPRLLLPTNPTGCLKFFQNRERAANASRRAALRHWVSHHYREADSSGLTYVRDHLRGHTEFRWADLVCELFVSAFDLEKHEAFKQEAAHWRAQRKHNRVRVRLKQRAEA